MLQKQYTNQLQAATERSDLAKPSALDKIIFSLITIVLCVTNIMLPIERGFASIKIASYPVALPMLVSFFSFAVLVFTQKDFLSSLFPKYVILQLVFIWYLILVTIFAPDIEYGIFVIMSYTTTFVVNFWVVHFLLRQGFRQGFIVIICAVVFFASLVGILEGAFGIVFPFYQQIYVSQEISYTFSYAISPFSNRVFGTLGNPIVYSIALTFVIPFVSDLKSRTIRFILMTLITIASLLTISTTSFIALVIFILGQVFIVARNLSRVLLILFMVAILAVVANMLISMYIPESYLKIWGNEANPENVNIVTRIELFRKGVNLILYDFSTSEMLWGRGTGSVGSDISRFNFNTRTFDNTYLSIAYEYGFIGIALYSLVLLYLLVRHISCANKTMHWYSVLALVMIGFSFYTTLYFTFNFIWTASVAFLIFQHRIDDNAQSYALPEHIQHQHGD
jgi:O-antigen ligase